MARNIEIKARIENVDALTARVVAVADRGPIEIYQDDTFFGCERGRMKLRTLSAGDGELIFYRRPDQKGPKESNYSIVPTAQPDSLRQVLSLAYGQIGQVRKRRSLYLIGRTRVHLDRVEGLGHFLELEVVLSDGESPQAGIEEAHKLATLLGIDSEQLIDAAYIDLLNP